MTVSSPASLIRVREDTVDMHPQQELVQAIDEHA